MQHAPSANVRLGRAFHQIARDVQFASEKLVIVAELKQL
jgi:hypothetical protein